MKHETYLKSIIIIFLICFFLSFCFGSYTLVKAEARASLGGEEKTMVGEGIEILKKTLNEVLVIWKEMHQKVMKWWKENILPKIQKWIEEKKPEIREEFEKEKKELKKEIKQTFSNFWQWLKDLIR